MLWLTCVIVPILSVSLLGGPTDPEIMQKPTGKNQCSITAEVCSLLGLNILIKLQNSLVLNSMKLFNVIVVILCYVVLWFEILTCCN